MKNILLGLLVIGISSPVLAHNFAKEIITVKNVGYEYVEISPKNAKCSAMDLPTPKIMPDQVLELGTIYANSDVKLFAYITPSRISGYKCSGLNTFNAKAMTEYFEFKGYYHIRGIDDPIIETVIPDITSTYTLEVKR